MLRTTLVILTGSLMLYQIPAFADADMFRPFEAYIESGPNYRYEGVTWDTFNQERYRVIRDKNYSSFKKQRYWNRHCGSAYINCHYPDQDYPRYNGPVYYLPRR